MLQNNPTLGSQYSRNLETVHGWYIELDYVGGSDRCGCYFCGLSFPDLITWDLRQWWYLQFVVSFPLLLIISCFLLVAQLCPTLCHPTDCSPPGSSLHGILQARILGWIAAPFSRGSSQPRDWTQVSCIAGRFLSSEGSPIYHITAGLIVCLTLRLFFCGQKLHLSFKSFPQH